MKQGKAGGFNRDQNPEGLTGPSSGVWAGAQSSDMHLKGTSELRVEHFGHHELETLLGALVVH